MQSMGIDPRGSESSLSERNVDFRLIVWREPDVGVYGARFFKAWGPTLDSYLAQDGEWIYEALLCSMY